jgi:hypothetical protein
MARQPMQADFLRLKLSRVMTSGQWAPKTLPLSTASTFTPHWDETAWKEGPSPNMDDGNYLGGVDGVTPMMFEPETIAFASNVCR